MEPIETRFWRKVNKTSECWEWTAGCDKDGYGKFDVHGKTVRAHIFSFFLHHGNIASDLLVLHRCDNPRCVRPDHLFAGTHKDNAQDRNSKNRHFVTSEDRGKNRKLTAEQVRAVIFMCRLGTHTQVEIATIFNITQSQVSRIKNRRHWKFI